MAVGSFKLPITSGSTPTPTPTEWVRPSDWLPMPTGITSANQTFVGLHAVFPAGQNYCAFNFTTSGAQYQVDWGDGTIDLVNSGVNAEHNYDYSTYDPGNTTLCSRGYKQAIITVTVVSGDLLSCNFQQRFVTSPVQNVAYATGFLDCILSMPNALAYSSIVWAGSTIVRHGYVERFDFKTVGGCTDMQGMFSSCTSLQSVPLFNTVNVTNMQSMFSSCTSLQSVPLFNTANISDMSSMFNGCTSLQSVPLFNTANVIYMSNMFSGCSSLQSVPLFNTANVTSMTSMFLNCASLKNVPLFNTVSLTGSNGMNSMFSGCLSLQSVPLFNTANVTYMTSMFSGCSSLQSVPLFNTANVRSMFAMFQNCRLLKNIPALSTASVTNVSGSDFNSWTNCASLTRCEVAFTKQISLANGQLSRTAIVEIFNNLASRVSTTSATITITGNWGATALTTGERAIATAKNWVITG